LLIVLAAQMAVARLAFAAPPVAPLSKEVVEEGREHFTRGVALFRESDFRGALVEFQRAYATAPSYRILYNLGQTYLELHEYASALTAFQKYVAEGGAQLASARRAEVDADVASLQQRVGRVTVTTSVVGGDVAVDDVSVGTTPLTAPILVGVGQRRISLTVAGRPSVSKTVDIAGGDDVPVVLELPVLLPPAPATVARPTLAPVPAEPPPPAQRPARPLTPVWIGVGVTGALVAASAVFGVLTVGANNSLNADLGRFPGSPGDIDSARSQVHTFALASDVLTATAIAAGGLTLYLGLSRRGIATTSRVAVEPGRVSFEAAF
jgi:hypothetical protein